MIPHWRLSGIYFFLFAFVGMFAPYWSPYLSSKGLSAEQIGVVFALMCLVRVVVPHVWAFLGDKVGRHLVLARVALVGAMLTFAIHAQFDTYTLLLLSGLCYAVFWDGCLPQFEAVTLRHLHGQSHRYARIRVWGSIGFIVTSYGAGVWLEWFAISTLPILMLVTMGLLLINSCLLRDAATSAHDTGSKGIRAVLSHPMIWLFLIACFFLQASHGAYYGFYSLYLSEHGYAESTIGALWAIGVVAEVLVFWWMPQISDPRHLAKFWVAAFLLTTLRWFVIATYPDNAYLIFAVQLIHAASFGVFHAVAIQFINHWFSGGHLAKGQALYSAVGFGGGVAFGSYISGVAWDRWSPGSTFYLAAGLCVLATLAAVTMHIQREKI